MSAVIVTSQGLPIFVDRADFPRLYKHTWHVSHVGNKSYAATAYNEAAEKRQKEMEYA